MTVVQLRAAPGFSLEDGPGALAAAPEAWDELALAEQTPFLTHAWFSAWLMSRARRPVVCAVLRGHDGSLRAGALLQRIPGGLAAAADAESGDWDAVAASLADRRRLWDEIAALEAPRIVLDGLRVGSASSAVALDALARAGYGLLEGVVEARRPYLDLPASFDDLLATLTRDARWRWRSRRRAFDRAGAARFRVTTGGPGLDRDLDELLRVESHRGPAIVGAPSDVRLFRALAHGEAACGRLRLALLELDGAVVAADLQFAVDGVLTSVRSGYDERCAALSPGFVLRGETLRAAIDEGLTGVDVVARAGADELWWADRLRPRRRVVAVRGAAGRLAQHAWSVPRAGMVTARSALRQGRPPARARARR